MNLLPYLEKKSRLFWAVVVITLVGGIGFLDVLTGPELAFSLFYLLPVSLAAWFGGKRFGLVTTVIGALAWSVADFLSERHYSHPFIPYWNTTIRFGVFLVTALLMSALKQALQREQKLSRIDMLTGAVSRRFFADLLQMELDRSRRSKHPLTLAYVDLDNFKTINDRLGHCVGDQVLTATVKQVKGQLRKTDVIARLGGDEFAILLPETHNVAAKAVISMVQAHFLDEMRQNNWPVTLSIGVLTCTKIPLTTDDLLQQADALMYAAKNQGKNVIRYSVYAG